MTRPADISAILYGRIAAAQQAAEADYWRHRQRTEETPPGPNRHRAALLAAHADGIADGLARAVAILDGSTPAAIRTRTQPDERAPSGQA